MFSQVAVGYSLQARFIAKMRAGDPLTLTVLSDSTGNNTSDWFYRFVNTKLAPAFTDYYITYRLWNDGTQGYDAPVFFNSSSAPHALAIYNASDPGATADYHASRIALTCPVEPDLTLISLGLNPDAQAADLYMTSMDDLVAALLAVWPDTPIITVAENPTLNQYASATAARFQALRDGWRSRGWGFMDANYAFTSSASSITTLIDPDLKHPSIPAGSTLWANAAATFFQI